MIITADWHLRGDRPRCRLDADWIETQRNSIRQIVDFANEKQDHLCIIGDIFNTARVATEVVNMTIEELLRCDKPPLLLAGNHDLPYHSYEKVNQSSFGILKKIFPELGTDAATRFIGEHSANPFDLDDFEADSKIVFTHVLCFPDEDSRPMEECGITAEELLAKFPNAETIFTGDYHTAFIFEKDGRRVINPGCINRQVADYYDYVPRVWHVTDEGVEPYFLEDPMEMVTDDYLRKVEERDERIDSFLEMVEFKGSLSLSFTDNVNAALADNNIQPDIAAEVSEIISGLNQEKPK